MSRLKTPAQDAKSGRRLRSPSHLACKLPRFEGRAQIGAGRAPAHHWTFRGLLSILHARVRKTNGWEREGWEREGWEREEREREEREREGWKREKIFG